LIYLSILWAFNLVNKIIFVKNKIHHRFSNLVYAFMLEHSVLVCCFCFILFVFAQNAIWKDVLEKKTKKNLENKKKRKEKGRSPENQPSSFLSPLFPRSPCFLPPRPS